MSHLYLDASAVVKRYSYEPGSPRVRTLANPDVGNVVLLSEITLVEVAAALAAKHRAPGGTTQKERDDAIALFLSHCVDEYVLVSVSLTQNHRLLGYDAVQLASALVTNDLLAAAGLLHLTFVAADDDLMVAARLEGLIAENPNVPQ